VDPKLSFVQASESQARGFERAFTDFADWCRRTPAECPIGPDARASVTAAMAKAATAPVRGRDGRAATAGWIFLAVVSSLYVQDSWGELANAVRDLGNGDASGVFRLADTYAEREPNGHYSNLMDANLATSCADNAQKVSVAQIRTLQAQWRAKYPLFGASLAVELLQCAFWPVRPDPYPAGRAVGAPPIVVVGTTGDPATPYEQTAETGTCSPGRARGTPRTRTRRASPGPSTRTC
jgi:TAP-like protein